MTNKFGYFSAKELGAAFRAERKALGYTQQQVAEKCHFRRQTISDLERGENVEIFTLMTALTSIGKGMRIIDRHSYDPEDLKALFDEDEEG